MPEQQLDDAIWEIAHVPYAPIDLEQRYELLRDTVAAYLNERLFRRTD